MSLNLLIAVTVIFPGGGCRGGAQRRGAKPANRVSSVVFGCCMKTLGLCRLCVSLIGSSSLEGVDFISIIIAYVVCVLILYVYMLGYDCKCIEKSAYVHTIDLYIFFFIHVCVCTYIRIYIYIYTHTYV